MKTRVRITITDYEHNEYKAGEVGYVDGYIRGGNDKPFAVVVFADGRFVMVHLTCLIRID